jgi:hypothetical protein
MRNTHNIAPKEYRKIHYWLRNTFGIAKECQNKKCSGKSKNYEYALITGKKYEYARDNYLTLCKSCHSAYDTTDKTRQKISIANKGRKWTKLQLKNRFKPVRQLTIDGKIVKDFSSLLEASKKTGISIGSISLCLTGKYKKTKGFDNLSVYYKWEYGKRN